MLLKSVRLNILVVICGLLVALPNPVDAFQKSAPAKSGGANKSHAHEHNHAKHGPNGGELLEVGKHEYHLELCLDESSNKATVYILDHTSKNYVPIDQPHLLVNFKANGKPTQLKFEATPRKEDKAGTSSSFGHTNASFIEALHDSKSDMRIVVRIKNKQFNVRVVHDHSHTNHGSSSPKKSAGANVN